MKKKIFLVKLPYKGSFYSKMIDIPAGLAMLSEVLTQNDIDHEIVDMQLAPSIKSLYLKIEKYKPDYIGFSMFTFRYLDNYKLERQKLEELYNRAVKIEDVIKVQERITQVQRQIDRYDAQLKNIERILLQFFILFIVGWIVSLLIGNLLITFFTCFLVSMMFNWKKIEGYRKKMKTKQPTQQSYCPQCGSKLLSGSQFCHSCGSKMMTPSTSPSIVSGEYYSQQDLWLTYKTIKENYEKGKIDSQTYSWFFSEIVSI